MRHRLQAAVTDGMVDGTLLAEAFADREPWLPSGLTANSEVRYERLLAAVVAGREDVLARMRRSPAHVATLFALLPAAWMLELFGAIEAHDERMLLQAVESTNKHSLIGRLATARLGWMRAIATLTRLVSRSRNRVRVTGPGFS